MTMTIFPKWVLTTTCLLVLFSLTGCASIFCGTNQNVDIKSSPMNAKVTVNYKYAGQTPLTVKLPRNANNRIKIELEGYEPYEITTTKGFNPATLGNILIGGAIGMLIDLATGGIYTVNPEYVSANLKKIKEDNIVGMQVIENVPPEMQPHLVKIGQLKRN